MVRANLEMTSWPEDDAIGDDLITTTAAVIVGVMERTHTSNPVSRF